MLRKFILALTATVAIIAPLTAVASPAEASPRSNAIDMAYSYIDTMAFSKAGLADQLVYEGFSQKTANYAVENISVSWRKQAVRMAKSYLSTMAFSCTGLIDQLVYEKFSRSVATYGANHTNAC